MGNWPQLKCAPHFCFVSKLKFCASLKRDEKSSLPLKPSLFHLGIINFMELICHIYVTGQNYMQVESLSPSPIS